MRQHLLRPDKLTAQVIHQNAGRLGPYLLDRVNVLEVLVRGNDLVIDMDAGWKKDEANAQVVNNGYASCIV